MAARRPRTLRQSADGDDGDDAGSGTLLAVEPVFANQRDMLQQLLADPARLHHAMLLTGAPGIGKAAAALTIARALLCEAPRQQRPDPAFGCGQCPSCHWFASGNHPDVRRVSLLLKDDKLANDIGIDQIRDLDEFIAMSAFRGGSRVVIIDPAERLNTASANALLKMLEEPGPATVFLVVTHRPDDLPATVRSRCRRVDLPSPDPLTAAAWLAQAAAVPPEEAARLLAWAGGAPLHARDLADAAHLAAHRSTVEAIAGLPETRLIVAADRVGSAQPADWYPILQRWTADLLRVGSGSRPRFFPESADRMSALMRRTSLDRLTTMAIALQRRAGLVRHPLNPRLFLEESLAAYLDAFENRRG